MRVFLLHANPLMLIDTQIQRCHAYAFSLRSVGSSKPQGWSCQIQRKSGRSCSHRKCIEIMRYGWWTKSCTTKDDDYPMNYRVLTIPGGAGIRPSTVSWDYCLISKKKWNKKLTSQKDVALIRDELWTIDRCGQGCREGLNTKIDLTYQQVLLYHI